MVDPGKQIIIGVLGQWASGKSTAAATLVRHLGGPGEVSFISDRELLAAQAVNHLLGLDPTKIKATIEADGWQRLEGEQTTVYLKPGEDLNRVDLHTLLFDLHGNVIWDWLTRARAGIGHQLRARLAAGKPVVIEAGFGSNTAPTGPNPFSHTIADLFEGLAESGVAPHRVKWIIIEACYENRSARNQNRADSVPEVEFDQYAADDGDLEPGQQRRWEAQGMIIKRVANDHDDIDRFKADIIAAFEQMFGAGFPLAAAAGSGRQAAVTF